MTTFLIVFILVLAAVCVLHCFFTSPCNFRDWFVNKHAWIWIVGVVISFIILALFIESPLIFVCVFAAGLFIVFVGCNNWSTTKDAREKKNKEKNDNFFEECVYNKIDKMLIYSSCGTDFKIEKHKFTCYSNKLKKIIDNIYFDVKNRTNRDDCREDYYILRNFIGDSLEDVTKFEKKVIENRFKFVSTDLEVASFFDVKYNKISEYLLNFKESMCKTFLIIKGGYITPNKQDLRIYKILPEKLIEIERKNMKPYLRIFEIENFLRIYINLKYYAKYGNYSLDELFKYATKAKAKSQTRFETAQKQGWTMPLEQPIVFYVNFEDLESLLTASSNWDLFKDDFKSQDFIKLRLNELYDIRNKIAHNCSLSKSEITSLNRWCGQIYSQLSNYKEKIRNWKF